MYEYAQICTQNLLLYLNLIKIYMTSDEIAEMVEDVKEYTEEAMKIEMASWAEDYTTVDMDELYTELTSRTD